MLNPLQRYENGGRHRLRQLRYMAAVSTRIGRGKRRECPVSQNNPPQPVSRYSPA